jgi:hypothetical protein
MFATPSLSQRAPAGRIVGENRSLLDNTCIQARDIADWSITFKQRFGGIAATRTKKRRYAP